MTHDELLAKILETGATALQSSTLGGGWIYDAKTNALRAVVERHYPDREPEWVEGYFVCNECSIVEFDVEYPCSTVKDIEEKLK